VAGCASHVSAAATVGGLCVVLAWGWARLLESLNIGLQPQLYLAQPWLLFAVGALLFWACDRVSLCFDRIECIATAERRSLEADCWAREAELKALRAQLDPHFLLTA